MHHRRANTTSTCIFGRDEKHRFLFLIKTIRYKSILQCHGKKILNNIGQETNYNKSFTNCYSCKPMRRNF